MVTVTNDAKDFIENHKEELFIYGAGNSGYWIGYYLNRCGIEFSGYIDGNEKYCGALCQGKPVYLPEKLGEYKGINIRLIISPRAYEPILSDLLFHESKQGFQVLCFVPRYMHFSSKQEIYDINHFLGYFRRRLYNKDTPTIISNDCIGGHIYHLMHMPMLSPTINVGIESNDFLKICNAPKKYFAMEGKDVFYKVCPLGREPMDGRMRLLSMKVGDISVTFAHTNGKTNELVERWNMMRTRINWDNMIYVFRITDGTAPVSNRFMHDFSKLKEKHLILNHVENRVMCQVTEQIILPEYIFGTDRAIENDFDLLGWLNQDEREQDDGE